MKRLKCEICGWIYDPDKGCPGSNISPGVAWVDVEPTFVCPECGAGKDSFVPE